MYFAILWYELLGVVYNEVMIKLKYRIVVYTIRRSGIFIFYLSIMMMLQQLILIYHLSTVPFEQPVFKTNEFLDGSIVFIYSVC